MTNAHDKYGAMPDLLRSRVPVLRLLIPLLWAAALLIAFAVKAGVVLANLHSFSGSTAGRHPNSGLVQGSDGNLCGTTYSGGSNNQGTVFEISADGTFRSMYSFTGGNDGAYPQAGMVQGSDGSFYGTTSGGGARSNQSVIGQGTVFRLTSSRVDLTTLYSFTDGNSGGLPTACLVQGSDGSFYGTTYGGGTYSNGTVFKITANGTFTSLYSFTGRNDGGNPQAGLVQGSDGNFYSTTYSGGTYSNGTVFKITANGTFTSLYSFTGRDDGGNPEAGLVQGRDANFFGTATRGGTYTKGTVFKIGADGTFGRLYSFTGGNDGASPQAGLAQGTDGNFYSTTSNGGMKDLGTIFKISADGSFSSLYSFSGDSDGAYPFAGLVQGSDGNFYGTTFSGGIDGGGTVFRLTIVPAAPVFQEVKLTQGTLYLTWSTEAGASYQLQYNSNLRSTNWTSLGSPMTATALTLSATDYVTNGSPRLYQVVRLVAGH
jgi:uncharacterized repeat protein (TIGR03803 family)